MMTEEEKISLLVDLPDIPADLKVALYNIAIATEPENRGQPVSIYDCLQDDLENSLHSAYRDGKISRETCDYLCKCFL